MDEQEQILQKIACSELAQEPRTAGLLGLWQASRKEYPAAFLSFSVALQIKTDPFGFFAVAAWTAEWGIKPLPEDFQKEAPLASACFWAWAGKPAEGRLALAQADSSADEKLRQLLDVYLQILEAANNPASIPPDFRALLEAVLKTEFGVSSETTRRLFSEYESGNFSAVAAGLRPVLGELFVLPPFSTLDYLWILFSTGVDKIEFSAIIAALAELEDAGFDFARNWRQRQQAAGYLLLYFFLLRAGGESFEKALAINPNFSRAVKNADLVKEEKQELALQVKQFLVF